MTDENVLPSFESMMKSKRFNSHAQDDDYQRYDYENNPAKKAQEKAKLKAKKRAYDKKHEGESKPNLSKYSENKVRHSKAEYGKVPDKDELDDEHTPKTKDQKTAEYIARFQQSLPSFEEMMTGDAFAKVGQIRTHDKRGRPVSNEELIASGSPKTNARLARNLGTDNLYRGALVNTLPGRVQLGGALARQAPRRSNAGLDPTMTAAYIAKLKKNGILGNVMEAGGRRRVRDPLGRGYTLNQNGGIRVDEMTSAERYDNYEDLIENWGRFTRENPGLMEAYMTEEDPVKQQVAKERLFAEWDRFKAQTEEEKMRDFTNRVRERHADALPGWMAERYPDVDISQGIPDEYVQAYANEQMYGRDVTDSEGNVTHIDGHYDMLDRYNDAFERLIAENPDMDVKEAMAQARAESGLPEVTWRDKWWKGYDEKAEEAALAQNELEDKEAAQFLRDVEKLKTEKIAAYKKEQEKAGTPVPEQIPPDVMKGFEAKARSQLEGMTFASDMEYDVALQNIVRDFADNYRREEHVAENTTLPSEVLDRINAEANAEAEQMAKDRKAEKEKRLEAIQVTRAHLDEQRKAQEEATKAIDTIDRNMETAAETDARLKRKQQMDDSDRAQDLKRLMEIKGGNKSWIRDRFDDKSSELKELQDLAAKYGNEAELKDAFTDDWVTGSRGMESNWKFSKPLNKLSSFLSKPADAQDLADAQAASAAQSEYDKTQNAKKQLGGKAVEDVKYKGNIVGKVTRPAQDKDILNRKALNEKDKKEQSNAAHDKYNQERDEAKKKEAENMEDKTEEFKESTTPAFSDMLNDAFAKNHGPANRYPPMTNAQVMRDPYMRVDMRSDESEPINKMRIYDPEVITNGEGISVKNTDIDGPSIRKTALPSAAEMLASPETNWFAKAPPTDVETRQVSLDEFRDPPQKTLDDFQGTMRTTPMQGTVPAPAPAEDYSDYAALEKDEDPTSYELDKKRALDEMVEAAQQERANALRAARAVQPAKAPVSGYNPSPLSTLGVNSASDDMSISNPAELRDLTAYSRTFTPEELAVLTQKRMQDDGLSKEEAINRLGSAHQAVDAHNRAIAHENFNRPANAQKRLIKSMDEMMAEARPDVYFAKTNGTGIGKLRQNMATGKYLENISEGKGSRKELDMLADAELDAAKQALGDQEHDDVLHEKDEAHPCIGDEADRQS